MFLATFISACISIPDSFNKTQAGWKVIVLNDSTSKDKAWDIVSDSIKERDFEFAKIDKDSGYIRTAWNYRIYSDYKKTYATRIIIDFPSDGKKIRIKTEAQYLERGGEWIEGVDMNFQSTFREEISAMVGN